MDADVLGMDIKCILRVCMQVQMSDFCMEWMCIPYCYILLDLDVDENVYVLTDKINSIV